MSEFGAPAPAPVIGKDPFYTVKEKVQSVIAKLNPELSRWQELLETTNTAQNEEFKELTGTIKTKLASVQHDAKDLAQTIKIVEMKRERFKHIDDAELNARVKFVNDVKATIARCEESLSGERTKRKMDADSREALLGGRRNVVAVEEDSKGSRGRGGNGRPGGGRDYVEAKRQAQADIQERQEAVLGDMDDALARLMNRGQDIKTTLAEHNQALTEIDNSADEALSGMALAQRKMENMLKKGDRSRFCLIIILSLLVIMFLCLIIYT